MDPTVGSGLPFLSLAVSLVDIVLIIWLAAMATRKKPVPGHIFVAKTALVLYAVLAVVSAAGAFFLQQPGLPSPVIAFLFSIVALSIRLTVMILLLAWAWDQIEERLGCTVRECLTEMIGRTKSGSTR